MNPRLSSPWTIDLATAAVMLALGCLATSAQKAPAASDQAWLSSTSQKPGSLDLRPPAHLKTIDPTHRYTLPELIDLAEQQNPETRAVWQQARIRAADVGITRSDLLPIIAAVAIANTSRQAFSSTPPSCVRASACSNPCSV